MFGSFYIAITEPSAALPCKSEELLPQWPVYINTVTTTVMVAVSLIMFSQMLVRILRLIWIYGVYPWFHTKFFTAIKKVRGL